MKHLLLILALLAAPEAMAAPISGYPAAGTLDGTETVIGTQAGTTKQISIGAVAAMAPGSTITVGLSGAVSRTMAAKLGETVSVKDFGARCDGSTDDAAAIQAGINALNTAGGGTLLFPASSTPCKTTTTLQAKPNVILRGVGRKTSVVSYTGTGDAIASTQPINSSVAVHNGVVDLGVTCTSGSNTGAGYDDIGGTYVRLAGLRVSGCGYGIIFDQTELGDIDNADLELQLIGGLWWVNDGSHSAGALNQFTNRISLEHSQINEGSSAYGLIDDGGYTHVITDNNFNGGSTQYASAGGLGVIVEGNEFEGSSAQPMTFSNLTRAGATGPGQGVAITIRGNTIAAPTGVSDINFVSAADVVLYGNTWGGTSAAKIQGGANVNAMVLLGNYNPGGGATLGSSPAKLIQLDDGQGSFATPSLTLGSGTPITKMVVYSQSLTPASIGAATTAEQTFTVTGLTTADKVTVNGPTPTAGTGIVNVRVSATNTLAITFSNATAGTLTPAAGTYQILATRS